MSSALRSGDIHTFNLKKNYFKYLKYKKYL